MRRAFLIAFLVLAPVARAELVENVAARTDPSQTYTLVLPPGYAPANAHPTLLVSIRAGAAEEYGWIVISANGTRSDG